MATNAVGKSQVEETGGLGRLFEVETGDAADDEFTGAEAPDLSCVDFLLVLKDEDSLLSHGASLVISSMGSCC